MQEFFNKDIKKHEAKDVIRTINKMFKDIKDEKLKRYFIDSLTKHVISIMNVTLVVIESARFQVFHESGIYSM